MKNLLRNTILIFLFPLLSFLFVTDVNAASISWVGADGDWETGANWSGGVVPGYDDYVTIDANVTVSINGTTTISNLILGNSGGTTTPTLNFDYDAVTSGAFNVDTGDFIMYPGSVLTHTAGTTAVVGSIVVNILAGDFDIYDLATININEKGYSSSNGSGEGLDSGSDSGSGGGGYGGNGGKGEAGVAGGIAYGSMSSPANLGSGGGNASTYSYGGYGGGLARIIVNGTLTVSGDITANGQSNLSSSGAYIGGGGSGGGIYINATTVTGNGNITADGGNGGTDNNPDPAADAHGGGGGGGRIAVHYDSNTFSGAVSAYGGVGSSYGGQGGAGTIYLKDNALAYADLIVDNNNYVKEIREELRGLYGTTPIPSSSSFEDIIVRNNGELTVDSGATLSFATLDYSGGTIVENGTIDVGSSHTVPATGTYTMNAPKVFSFLIVNGTINHTQNTTALTYSLDLTVTNNMEIGTGGKIDVSNRGYLGSTGDGQGSDGSNNSGSGGAAHGGDGGHAEAGVIGGVAYGSITNPVTIGSGGGNGSVYSIGGKGGGLARIVVNGILSLTGDIVADGEDNLTTSGNYTGGGGAGGGIYLNVGTLTGGGDITADGGNGGTDNVVDPAGDTHSGGGGGGRIAVIYSSNSFTGNITAYGGNAFYYGGQGGAGTIYLKDNGSTYGDLIIDNNNYVKDSREDQRNLYATTPLSANETFGDIIVRNNGELTVNSGATLSLTTIDYAGGTIVENGTINLGSSHTVPATGTYTMNAPKTFDNLVVEGTVNHTHNTTAQTYSIDLTVTNNMEIASGGKIDLDYRGFNETLGDGQGSDGGFDSGGGGGAHGGNGGNGEAGVAGGVAYGSNTNPATIGSGGGIAGVYAAGGKGGGLASIVVGGTLTVTGDITANGELGEGAGVRWVGGGGAGGGIYIDAYSLSGSGNIIADGGNGGDGSTADGGGGGGGRIAIYYASNTFSGTVTAAGGIGPDSATDGLDGSVYYLQFFPPETTLDSFSDLLPMVEGHVLITYSDENGSSDLDKLYLKLVNPLGDDIEYYAEAGVDGSDLIPTEVSGSAYVEEITYDRTVNFPTGDDITITWNIKLNWDWTPSNDIEIAAKGVDDGGVSGAYVETTDANIIYTDNLNFSGTLGVLSTSKGAITTGTWVPTDDTLIWSGVKVVYNGTNISPDDSLFNVQITDNDDGLWTQELSSGSNISIQTTTDLTTDLSDEHTVSIVDLPVGANDASSLSFIVKVDGTTPNIVSLTGNYNNTWQSIESSPTLSWTDPNSPSDDIFYITTNGTEPSVTNYAALTTNSYYTTSALGEGTKTVKVRPRSGVGVYGTTRTYINKYDVTGPSKPTSFAATPTSTTSISLSWNTPTDTGSGFSKVVVMRSTSSFPTSVSSGTKIYEGVGTSYADSSLVSSTTYYYSIFAFDVLGNVSSPATISVATQSPPPPPPPPVVVPEPEPEEEVVEVVEEETVSVEEVNEYIENAEEFEKETITISTTIKDVEKTVEKSTSGGEEKPDIQVVKGESVTISIPRDFFDLENQEIDKVLAYLNGEIYTLLVGGDEYSTTFNAPGVSGSHILKLLAVYKNGDVKSTNISVQVDPYGYVYYIDGQGREVRVDTKVYLYVVIDGERVLWTGEDNPLSTGSTGEFSFFVPPGTYVLVVDEKGFKPYYSEEFEFEGDLVNINIQLEKDSLMDYLTTRNILIMVGVLLTLFVGYGVAVASKKRI